MHLDDVLTELVEHSGDRLLRVAYQLTHDAAAAQDLVQEALLRVYRSARRRGLIPEDWYAYLRRAVINEYVRTRRLRSSTEVVTDVVPERPAAGCLEDQAADQAELWAALGALSERQRAAGQQREQRHAGHPAATETEVGVASTLAGRPDLPHLGGEQVRCPHDRDKFRAAGQRLAPVT
jgi:DNA-directed RNA polymerase specialized sigma24 family protein